jgi:signal transduction histidine kinase
MSSKSDRGGLRISVRYKMLVAVSLALMASIGVYGYLAVNVFTEDKIAYIYDSNASLVEGVAEQTRATLAVLEKELALVAHEAMARGRSARVRAASAEDLFRLEQDLVRLQVWVPRKGGAPALIGEFTNGAALEATGLSRSDLESSRRERPVPFEAILAGAERLHIHNASQSSGVAILTVAYVSRDRSLVLVGDLLHERLLRLVSRSELHTTFLVDDRGEVVAHPRAEWVVERRDLSSNPLVRVALSADVASGVSEYVGEDGRAQLGAFRRVGQGRLWVLAHIPKDVALQASRDLVRRTALFAAAVLLVAFIASVFFSRLVTSPIRQLRAATEAVGQGQFDIDVRVSSRDEIGDLARAFDRMTTELKQVQSQLVQSEKLAAFGQLGAGITHEVKNPMTGIVSFAQLAQRKLDDPDKLKEFLQLIEKEALRCRDILVNFLKFARSGSRELERIDVNEVVDGAARMLRHQLSIHGVRLRTELRDDVPEILGNAPELQQVILNLGINAQQAMPDGGMVTIGTTRAGGDVCITVTDTGPGISPEIEAKIFEPFFSTKEPGEGTGLGLSVSFGIVRGHHGVLSVSSESGRGATFEIRIPAAPEAAPARNAPVAARGA